MRSQRRPRLVGIGIILIIVLLIGKATVTLISGRLGWTNYWGGPVFAPFVLVAAVLFIIAALRLRQEAPEGAASPQEVTTSQGASVRVGGSGLTLE